MMALVKGRETAAFIIGLLLMVAAPVVYFMFFYDDINRAMQMMPMIGLLDGGDKVREGIIRIRGLQLAHLLVFVVGAVIVALAWVSRMGGHQSNQ